MLSCPHCGHEVDELPDAVTIEVDRWKMMSEPEKNMYDGPEDIPGNRFVETTKGHSDQSTHICPECGEEGWNQGWYMEGVPVEKDWIAVNPETDEVVAKDETAEAVRSRLRMHLDLDPDDYDIVATPKFRGGGPF